MTAGQEAVSNYTAITQFTITLEPKIVEIPQELRDQIIDEEHLRLLTIGHYITGGFYILFASIFIIHFVLILVAALNPEFFGSPSEPQKGPPDSFMYIVAIFFGLFILAGWTFGGLTIYAGRCIKRRVRRTLTFVIACLNTLALPFGTVLGVFTLLVLARPGVKRLYGL